MADETATMTGDSAQDAPPADQTAASDGAAAEPKGPKWFNALLGRDRGSAHGPVAPVTRAAQGADASAAEAGEQDESDEDAPRTTEPRPRESGDGAQAEGSSHDPASPSEEPRPAHGRFYTDDEFRRAVQSHKDREIAAMRRQWDTQARQEAIETERTRLRQLRENDPAAFAAEVGRMEQERDAAEAQARMVGTTIRGTAESLDRAVLDPIVLALPAAARERLLPDGQGPSGIAGRRQLVEQGLRSLREHWTAEGERRALRKFRSDPAERKRLYREFADLDGEPEIAPGGPASRRPRSENDIMNAAIRAAARG
jgi:hypothetical protein